MNLKKIVLETIVITTLATTTVSMTEAGGIWAGSTANTRIQGAGVYNNGKIKGKTNTQESVKGLYDKKGNFVIIHKGRLYKGKYNRGVFQGKGRDQHRRKRRFGGLYVLVGR